MLIFMLLVMLILILLSHYMMVVVVIHFEKNTEDLESDKNKFSLKFGVWLSVLFKRSREKNYHNTEDCQ